ncbi:predicted coding region AF_1882 [Archaeoglobus fulgidus DSM 4304]|nr:RecName: Full=Uncharacterized protein AF_1882; Flags: Precursor [Archaeoglobus fulgidus DSM 4304]AAB89378.1 predicted coding region AF_1882 [Archaeoglobus fulgidus DSM 4304]
MVLFYEVLTISIFRRLPFLQRMLNKSQAKSKTCFQSPFSGASLSYTSVAVHLCPHPCSLSISIFRSLPFLHNRKVQAAGPLRGLSISIFRSLPFLPDYKRNPSPVQRHLSISIFRSLPFLRMGHMTQMAGQATFQSPFSGASLSYPSPLPLPELLFCIFQSPFSGASLSYAEIIPHYYHPYFALSISIFRSLPFLQAA